MANVFSQSGARAFLDEVMIFAFAGGRQLTYRLFKNNFTPGQSSVLGDFNEADYSGYLGSQAENVWSVAITAAGHAKTIGNLLSFGAHSGGPTNNTIYGVYVTDPGNTVLYYADLNPAGPVIMQPGSPNYQYIPVLTMLSEIL